MTNLTAWAADITVYIGGVDRSADLVGAGQIDRELDAAGLATVRLAYGTAKPSVGDAVSIAGLSAVAYVGLVLRVEYDPRDRVWVVSCTDGLQAQFEPLSSGVAVCALLPTGVIWHRDLHGDFSDGWSACRDAMSTIPYSIFMEDGTLHSVPWAGTGPGTVIAHASGGIYDQTVTLRESSARELIASATATVQIVYTRLHHWSLSCGWTVQIPPSEPDSSAPSWTDPAWDFRRWLIRPFRLPTRQQIADACHGNVWSLMGSGAGLISSGGDGLGIRTTGLPESGIWLADTYIPMDYAVTLRGCWPDAIYIAPNQGDTNESACITASWKMGRRWTQTVEETLTVTVAAPPGTPGAAVADESAHHRAPYDDTSWDASAATALPSGLGWQGGGSHVWADTLIEANRTLVIQGVTQTLATRIRASHRRTLVSCEVGPGEEPALGGRCTIQAQDFAAAGQCVRLVTAWDLDTDQIGCQVTMTPTAGSTADDDLGPPDPPDLSPSAAGYTLDGTLALGTHIGGLSSSPPQNDDWDGWVANVQATDLTNSWGIVDLTYPRPDSETYTEGFVLRTPDVPDAAREDQAGTMNMLYTINPLLGELVFT